MIKVKARQPVVHNRINAERGDEFELEKGEAEDMISRGIVARVADEGAPQTGVTDSPDTDDLLGDGDTKAEAAPQNKMQPAPQNKGAAPKPKK